LGFDKLTCHGSTVFRRRFVSSEPDKIRAHFNLDQLDASKVLITILATENHRIGETPIFIYFRDEDRHHGELSVLHVHLGHITELCLPQNTQIPPPTAHAIEAAATGFVGARKLQGTSFTEYCIEQRITLDFLRLRDKPNSAVWPEKVILTANFTSQVQADAWGLPESYDPLGFQDVSTLSAFHPLYLSASDVWPNLSE
jgi:hypothetical protein